MENKEQIELQVRLSNDKGDKIGEIRMMDVLDPEGNVLGKHAGMVLAPKIAADIKKHPDLAEQMKTIADGIHMVMLELVTREVETELETSEN